MPRRYRRRRYTLSRPLKTVRYSNETASFNVVKTIASGNQYVNGDPIAIVPSTSVAGTRKAKNFTLRLLLESIAPIRVQWALVFVPQGTTASNLQNSTNPDVFQSLYEPNQNVIMSGMIIASPYAILNNIPYYSPVTPTTFKTRLARNLDSGDSIRLVWVAYTPTGDGAPADTNAVLTGQCNFAISY